LNAQDDKEFLEQAYQRPRVCLDLRPFHARRDDSGEDVAFANAMPVLQKRQLHQAGAYSTMTIMGEDEADA
jgi:hypothetical protein